MKYKVGDRVRVRSDLRETKTIDEIEEYGTNVNSDMVKMAGKVVTIDRAGELNYSIKEDGYIWTDRMFEGLDYSLVTLGKETLFNMPIGTKIITGKGRELIYDGDCFSNKDDAFFIKEIENDLSLTDDTDDTDDGGHYDRIVEVQEPEYKTVWKEVPKKMTLKEIEKELGYPVKIVEEE